MFQARTGGRHQLAKELYELLYPLCAPVSSPNGRGASNFRLEKDVRIPSKAEQVIQSLNEQFLFASLL